MTKDEAAKQLGLEVYDTALPQHWLDGMSNSGCMKYDKALSSFVLCYDGKTFTGFPRPLTKEAVSALEQHNKTQGSHYNTEFTTID